MKDIHTLIALKSAVELNRFKSLYYYKWDWDGALSALEMAQKLAPNNKEVLSNLIFLHL